MTVFCLAMWPIPPLCTLTRSHTDHPIRQRVAAGKPTKTTLCNSLKFVEQFSISSEGRVLTDVRHSGERGTVDRTAPPVLTACG